MKYIATVKSYERPLKTRHFDNLESAEEFLDKEYTSYEAKGYVLHAIRGDGDSVMMKRENGKQHFIVLGAHEI